MYKLSTLNLGLSIHRGISLFAIDIIYFLGTKHIRIEKDIEIILTLYINLITMFIFNYSFQSFIVSNDIVLKLLHDRISREESFKTEAWFVLLHIPFKVRTVGKQWYQKSNHGNCCIIRNAASTGLSWVTIDLSMLEATFTELSLFCFQAQWRL